MNLVTRWLVALAVVALPLAGWADELQTQTDLHHDINGAGVTKMRGVKGVRYALADGKIVVTVPNDEWALNHLSKDVPEWFSHLRAARVTVWAGVDQSGWTPSGALSDFVAAKKAVVGGTWTSPETVNVAGVPAMKVTGYDVFGNYWYEAYAVTRPQMQYMITVRTPYENRWNTALNSDIGWWVTHVHPSTPAVLEKLQDDRAK